jgi:hypothetical protein
MRNFGWFASVLVVLFGPGCSAHDDPPLNSGPYSRIDDCTLIQQSTPAKAVCGDKTYKAVELAEIRYGSECGAAGLVWLAGTATASPTLAASVNTP